MATGHLFANLQETYQFTQAIRDAQKNFVSKFLAFFSDSLYNYGLLGYTSFLLGATLRLVGIKYFHKTLCFCEEEECVTSNEWVDDDPSTYSGYHLVRLGVCLQGIGIMVITSELLQLLRLHPSVRLFCEGVTKCLKHIFSFFFTYIIITLTFSASIHFVLRHAMGDCSGGAGMRGAHLFEVCKKQNAQNESCEGIENSDTSLFNLTALMAVNDSHNAEQMQTSTVRQLPPPLSNP